MTDRASDLKYGPGSALWKYWTHGEGAAKWVGAVHKWTTLRRELLKAGVPAPMVDGLTTNIIEAVMPGYMKQAHAEKGHRSMTTTTFTRSYPLDDIRVRSGGDGRTVEAYAAVFDTPTEIRDQDGHYQEVISRSAFDKTIAERGGKFGVFYNHGLTLHGTPSDRHSMPIGTPTEVRADGRGVFTVTRYNRTPLADEVLEAIKEGAITGQSFSGRMIQSNPKRGPHRPRNGQLPTVTRSEIALREYGPTPFPAYEDAGILGVRALLRAYGLGAVDLDDDEALELARTAIPVHHTATVDTPWDGGQAESRLDPEDDAAMKAVYAWYDSSAPDPDDDGYPDRKSDWKFPHHEVSADGRPGAANLGGVRNALARLADADIPDADKAKVRAHLEAHLNDAQRSTTLPLGEPGADTDTPAEGAVTAEPEPTQGHHSGPVRKRSEALRMLIEKGMVLR